MQVKVEDAAPCRKVLHIEVPEETVAAEFAVVTQEFSRVARVPGFRPGRVPPKVIELRFAKEIADAVRDRLLPRTYQQALAQEKIKPVALVDLKPAAIARNRPFAFDVFVDIMPDFILPEYRQLKLAAKPVEVKDEQVQAGVQELRWREGKTVDVKERGAQSGDFIQLDFIGLCDGQPIKAVGGEPAAGIGEGKDFWSRLGEAEFLPGLTPALAEVKTGETRAAKIAFPQDYRIPVLAGKVGEYTLTVKQIRSRQPAEMNAAFFNAVGVASEQELRERVRASLQAVGEYAERQRLRGEVLQWLSARTELKDLPASLVAEETGRILREVVRENVQRGVQQEELESHKEELFNHAVQSSSERVKLDFILYRIAGAEKIEVTDEELAAEIERLAQRYGLAPAKLRAGLEKRGALEGLRDDLRAEKTITFLVALAQPPAEAA